MNNIEILSPAGKMDSLIAAVRCGANAVYLGTKDINARRGADNFELSELRDAVAYCHSRGVKVYLTLNILVSDHEIKSAYNTVNAAMEYGVDGFIVQDLGLARIIHSCFPEARLHASTQCSVNTPDGFRALEELGFVRAVIPREMSLDEIKEIRRSTNMELEMFVHGALCMSVSGQCYLSAMLGGRSGNRGLCAQPCRLSFSADNSGSCDLSLKDLSLIEHINEIAAAGVASLKIEGRMKRPEYVAAAVTACKKAINSTYTADDKELLQSVFSRTGFTDGYFTKLRSDMFGTRQREDVVAAQKVLSELSRLYDKENPLLPVDFDFVCRQGECTTLTARANGREATAVSVIPEMAINKPMTVESVNARLQKLGNTQYYAGKINIELDEGLIMPASAINALRREAVEKLNEQSIKPFTAYPLTQKKALAKTGKPYYTARFLNADSVPPTHPFRRIFIPVWSSDEQFIKTGAGAELPRGLFGCEEKLRTRLMELKNIGVTTTLCSNLGAYRTAEDLGFEVYGDFGLNIFNSETADMFSSPILSFEINLSQANCINKTDTGIIGYGKLPLMMSRNCPIKNKTGCEKCKQNGALTDRKGFKFSVKCSPYPCVELLNPVPLYMGDRQGEIHTDFIHFYFTDESRNEVENIIGLFENKLPFNGDYTRGLYYRGVR